jgi:hypothetical protein
MGLFRPFISSREEQLAFVKQYNFEWASGLALPKFS